MTKHIEALKEAIGPVRSRLIGHPVYSSIRSPEDLHLFMQHHVYAVWDFMSLLKSLQRELTAVTLPWVPRGNANTRYLINEIVTGEESDVDEQGRRTSHFELYLRAMQQAGAAVGPINRLIKAVVQGQPASSAIAAHVPGESIRQFLQFTFDTIASGETHAVAAVFTFGREDLIPDMFLKIVADLAKDDPERLTVFTYYLQRHIEVDGGHHSHLAMSMVEELCGDDREKWATATRYAKLALETRIRLWDGVVAAIREKTAVGV